jgi:hypothetical protein
MRGHEPRDGGHQFVGLVGLLVSLGAHDAVAGVVVEQSERDLVERRLDRADLREHVDAVAVVFDHAFNAADLSFDALEALDELVLGGGVAARRCRPRGGVGRGGGGAGRHGGRAPQVVGGAL